MRMFWIQIKYDGRWRRYKVQQLETVAEREYYKVIAGNGELLLSNNRPVLVRRQLKHRQPDWKVEGTQLKNFTIYEGIILALNNHLKAD